MPLVSVVIPTHRRPSYLGRAIESALASAPGGDVEVIVVPNGPDEAWKEVASRFVHETRVQWHPVETGHANVARNHGMSLATGDYLRFLDDDDYLFPAASVRQAEALAASGGDIASGAIALVGENDREFREWRQPATDDYCIATFSPARNCLPHAHLYRREAVQQLRWNPQVHVRQDLDWHFTVCAAGEWRWVRTDERIGVWRHHWGSRISRSKGFNETRAGTVPMILSAHDALLASDRLSPDRRRAVAAALWSLVHVAFFASPRFWMSVAATASRIDPTSRPKAALFHWPVLRRLPPVLIEWMLLPKRWLAHELFSALQRLRLRHYW